jgi:hypothetical protein
MAAHSDPKTTRLYDRRRDEITLDEVVKIAMRGAVHAALPAGASDFWRRQVAERKVVPRFLFPSVAAVI